MAEIGKGSVIYALRLDLDNQIESMNMVAADLDELIISAAVAMNDYQKAKARIDLIEQGVLLNPDVTAMYTNEKQRVAAVKIHLAADDNYLGALDDVYKTYERKAECEARVESMRATLSGWKRKCEMTVAVVRAAGAE